MSRAIMWFRRDLRLIDNPALLRALAEHTDVVPVFVVDPNLLKNAGAGVEFVSAVNAAYTFIWLDQATSGVYRADNARVSGRC